MNTKKRVLIVEDDRRLLDLLRLSFEEMGCDVESAISFRGGLELVRRKGLPDLIVSDLNFLLFEEPESSGNRPRRLGFEFHRQLIVDYSDEKTPLPPFILHTGDDEGETIEQAKAEGMIYQHKGYSIGPTLMDVVGQIFCAEIAQKRS